MRLLQSLPLTLFALAPSPTIIFASLTEHPINECYDHEFSTYNASATVNFPPLSQNITKSSLVTWKLSTAVKEVIKYQDKNSVVKQKWWLEGDSKLSADPSLSPIDGCIIYLEATPKSTFLGKGADNKTTQNGCSLVLTPECQNAMLNLVISNITSYSNKNLDDHWTICPTIAHLLEQPPQECKADYHFKSVVLQTFGNPEFFAPAENGCNDTDFDIFEGSAIRNSFLELVSSASSLGDHKTYDQIVDKTNPLLLVSWPRNRTQSWSPDAQIVCLTPSEGVVTGSRIPGSKSEEDGSDKEKKNTAANASHDESLFALWMLLLIVSLTL